MISATFQHPQSYMAPEILTSNEDTRKYSVIVDMWATGVLVHEMLTGVTPFRCRRWRQHIIALLWHLVSEACASVLLPPYVRVAVI